MGAGQEGFILSVRSNWDVLIFLEIEPADLK